MTTDNTWNSLTRRDFRTRACLIVVILVCLVVRLQPLAESTSDPAESHSDNIPDHMQIAAETDTDDSLQSAPLETESATAATAESQLEPETSLAAAESHSDNIPDNLQIAAETDTDDSMQSAPLETESPAAATSESRLVSETAAAETKGAAESDPGRIASDTHNTVQSDIETASQLMTNLTSPSVDENFAAKLEGQQTAADIPPETQSEPGYYLPSTGGRGPLPYTAAGTFIMFVAGLMYRKNSHGKSSGKKSSGNYCAEP
ncbi:MAG TPA: hypothetical protein GXZ64_06255 [Clostridiaceae bacterium]|nr:hypothetical protein [Clostridiaceae bacterium]